MAKNRFIEDLRRRSKKYAKIAQNDTRWDHDRGIKIYHVYDGRCSG